MKVWSVITLVVFSVGIFFWLVTAEPKTKETVDVPDSIANSTPIPTQVTIPNQHIIPEQLHVFQTFNNCGPATLSMALSYLGQQVSQKELGDQLRPYQVAGGDNDDKSVSLQEVVDEAQRRGFLAYLRPNGSLETLKQFLAADIVVITRTWLKVNEDIGHYRVIRGYDDTSQEIIQDDSLQGKNLRYTYDTFITLWRPFNYEYAIIVPAEKRSLVESILREDLDEQIAWQHAKVRMEEELQNDPRNWQLIFALSRIEYYLKDYSESVRLFNSIESQISSRTLWYQLEPLQAIEATGDYQRVFTITTQIINNQNRAYSELYYMRGTIYEKQGNLSQAKSEYEKAVFYNNKNPQFQQALSGLQQKFQ